MSNLIPNGGLALADPKSVLGIEAGAAQLPSLPIFGTLWGLLLDRELSSADRVGLFTPERRKQAINDAHLEFCRRTRCLDQQVGIVLGDGVAEYSLDYACPGFLGLTPQAVSIQIETLGKPGARYLQGDDDLPRRSIVWLDQEWPGWRGAPAGTPTATYVRRDRAGFLFGMAPAPRIPATETWTVVIGAYLQPLPMVNDGDQPFALPGAMQVRLSLRPYVQAVLYLAASYMEKYRKDAQREAMFLQLYDTECEKYIAEQKPVGVRRVRVGHDYRQIGRRGHGRMARDPRVW